LLRVIGAVQYGTANVFSKIVPHFDTETLRHSLHHVMPIFGKTDKDVVMVVDRSGIHRAQKLASTLAHDDGQ
jgi:adenine/guanine phosphoribosyltransferase-like PRPP-binding protein